MSGSIYGLKLPCRQVGSVCGSDTNQFLVASCSLREENEIHLVNFDGERGEVTRKALFSFPKDDPIHKGEVWTLTPHPSDPTLFFTCCHTGDGRYVTQCWAMPSIDGGQQLGVPLQLRYTFEGRREISRVIVQPQLGSVRGAPLQLGVISECGLQVYSAPQGTTRFVAQGSPYACTTGAFTMAGAWDPLHPHLVAVAKGGDLVVVDMRTNNEGLHVPGAHYAPIMALDFAPTTQYRLATGCTDGTIKLWDVRQNGEELACVPDAHMHWVETLSFNTYHDELLVSASTDATVRLWRTDLILDTPTAAGACVEAYRDHEDSVHSCCWGTNEMDPWCIASGDDARVVHAIPNVMQNPGDAKRKDAAQYMKDKKITQILEIITAPLLFHRPEDPNAFLVDQLRSLHDSRAEHPLFSTEDLDCIFSMYDVLQQGTITRSQLEGALQTLGCAEFARLPKGNAPVDKTTFVSLASAALTSQLESL
ncbi:putative Protein TSSC1 [Paratrimastix pyriformis]|uniref:EF-hand domain-containing protein n=1 Tax=Paratrimastix pyriformis TaxID=342808 RepID=A0ABQ8UZD1_9EUKA|nr:putative Protein TSSC1 [Paratrimastix pyriformis]